MSELLFRPPSLVGKAMMNGEWRSPARFLRSRFAIFAFASPVTLMAITGILLLTGCNRDRTPPTVTITQPANNSLVGGVVKIQARATDDRSTPFVDFYVDNAYKATDSTGSDSTYTTTWDASALDTGSTHTIKAVATDAAGNVDTSSTVTVTIGIPAGPTNHSGLVNSSEIWDPRGNPHVVTGDLTITGVVTLRPGVEVRVDSAAKIAVIGKGGLIARGTAGEPITFTANTHAAPGAWQGITIGGGVNGDSVDFEYCTIEYGGKDTLSANLSTSSLPMIVRNCTIRDGAGYGVRTFGDNLQVFAANTITGNAGPAMLIDSRYVGVMANDNQLGGNGRNIVVTDGLVDRDATWNNLGAAYTITADVMVGRYGGAVLTLNPGVELRFRPGLQMVVGGPDSNSLGGLIVAGNAGSPVVFTSDSSLPSPGDWLGIDLGHVRFGDSVWIDNARIEYSGGNGKGAIFLDSTPARVTNTTIVTSSTNGVYALNGGFSEFTGNNISQCSGYPVRIEPEYVSTIGDNALFNSPNSGVLVAAGQLKTGGIWQNHQFPYVIGGFVDIGDVSHPVLILAQGDSLLFQPGAGIRVGAYGYTPRDSGALVADRVFFTSVSPQVIYWQGVQFQNYALSAQCILHNSVVEYAGADSLHPGDVVCQDANPSITNTEIAYSQRFGIYLINSTLNRDTLIADNNIHDNPSGAIGP